MTGDVWVMVGRVRSGRSDVVEMRSIFSYLGLLGSIHGFGAAQLHGLNPQHYHIVSKVH